MGVFTKIKKIQIENAKCCSFIFTSEPTLSLLDSNNKPFVNTPIKKKKGAKCFDFNGIDSVKIKIPFTFIDSIIFNNCSGEVSVLKSDDISDLVFKNSFVTLKRCISKDMKVSAFKSTITASRFFVENAEIHANDSNFYLHKSFMTNLILSACDSSKIIARDENNMIADVKVSAVTNSKIKINYIHSISHFCSQESTLSASGFGTQIMSKHLYSSLENRVFLEFGKDIKVNNDEFYYYLNLEYRMLKENRPKATQLSKFYDLKEADFIKRAIERTAKSQESEISEYKQRVLNDIKAIDSLVNEKNKIFDYEKFNKLRQNAFSNCDRIRQKNHIIDIEEYRNFVFDSKNKLNEYKSIFEKYKNPSKNVKMLESLLKKNYPTDDITLHNREYYINLLKTVEFTDLELDESMTINLDKLYFLYDIDKTVSKKKMARF